MRRDIKMAKVVENRGKEEQKNNGTKPIVLRRQLNDSPKILS